MDPEASTTKASILDAARQVLADDAGAPVAVIAARAGVSRATFYRWFPSRALLLDALEIDPDPGTAARIRTAALQLLDRDGLTRLSMDDLAELSGVSRASVYRIYPGKTALFAALLAAESPFKEVSATLHRMHDRPPAEVLPALLEIVERVASPRFGILRALMFEVTAGTPEAVEAASWALKPMLGEIAGYFAGQMDAGTVRRMHPILAGQAVVGPLMFHLATRSIAAPLAGLDLDPALAAQAFAGIALRGLAPDPTEE